MIDISQHTLIYKCRETKKVFHGKVLAERSVSIIDPETGREETFTRYHLHKKFYGDKNNKMKNRPEHSKPKINIKLRGTKEWREYMFGVEQYCTNG